MNLPTARRPEAGDYAYAAQLAARIGVQNAARATGVDRVALAGLSRPVVRQSYRPPSVVDPAPAAELEADGPPAPLLSPRARAVAAVLLETAIRHGITVADLKGPCRLRRFAWPRQEVMWRLVYEVGLSRLRTGGILGGRDHTTILHGVKAYAKRIAGGAE